MINKNIPAKKIVALIVFFSTICLGRLFAQTESYIQTLTGIIKPDAVCKIADEKFADQQLWASIKTNNKVQNLITFEIRLDTVAEFNNKPFGCELVVDIDYKDSSNTERTIPNVKLVLQYDTARGKSYKGVAYYKFDGGHDVTVTVKSINSKEIDVTKAGFLRVKNQILIERTYKKREGNAAAAILSKYVQKNTNAKAGIPDNNLIAIDPSNSDTYRMTITWDPLDYEYDKFDFEYTFYDANSQLARQSLSSGNFDQAKLATAFKNNATRVSLDVNNYKLNLVFPNGYLLVRVRAYTYNLVDGEWDREEGAWHYIGDNTGINNFAVYPVNEHETLDGNNYPIRLNWQYSAAFAEEGKRKEIVSYFDGGSKSRQSVTISNSDNKSVVAESVLDKQNRPAVSVLPVPVEDETIHYFPAFNKNTNAGVYSYADFNPDNNCASNAMPMNAAFGASKYYSPNNSWVDEAITRDVPNAFGYPFAVTEFTNDQTGRIRRQGGVGQQFQIGNHHETSYYYGKPAQPELDRLFGSEAGAAAHYAKNMVVDANGQVSVSYIDIAGKTVATALAGKAPDKLKALASASGPGSDRTITDELIRPQAIVRDASGLRLSFNTTVLVPGAADYDFNYEFSGRSLELLFGWNPAKQVCADCYYDVKFSISDECNAPVTLTYNGSTYTQLLVPATFNYGSSSTDPNTTCGVVIPTQSGDIKAAFLKAGEYKVSYELLMSRKALDFYMDYIKQAAVTKTIDEYKKDYLKKIDLTGCFNDCKDCIQKLGSLQDFKKRLTKILHDIDNITLDPDPAGADQTWLTNLYNATLASCSESVSKNCTITDGCAEYRKMMLKDVTPGGQYMLYDATTLLFKERTVNPVNGDIVNAFLKAKNDVSPNAPKVIIDGTERYLRDLQESELISNWNPEWSYMLLKYHPEYCLLEDCEAQSDSKNRDKAMLQTDDDGEAWSKYSWQANDYSGFLTAEQNAIVANPGPYNPSCIMDGISAKVNVFIPNATVRNPVPNKTYNPNDPTTYTPGTANISLMQFIKYTLYCPDNVKPAENNDHKLPFIPLAGIPQNITCPTPLAEWRTFRNLYIALKQAAYRNPLCKTSRQDCGNCYIGVNALSSLFAPKADPLYYPQLKDFVIEKDAAGTGLQLRYDNEGAINNRCDVYVNKVVLSGSSVTTTLALKALYQENGTKIFPIPGAVAGDIDIYFTEHIINNYNHNIDIVSPGGYCPTSADFSVSIIGSTAKISYIGAHPLLTTTKVVINLTKFCNFFNCHDDDEEFVFDPLTTESIRTFPQLHGEYEWRSVVCTTGPASCPGNDRWPSYFQKTRRFYESSSVDDINTVLQGGAGQSPVSDPSNGNSPQQNAEEMAEGWIEKLKHCFNDPEHPSADPRYTALRQGLIEVCVAGTDQMHPYGASTTKDDIPTANGHYTSFKDVIVAVFGAESATCNHFAIDFPLPYKDKTPLNDELVNKLTECGYKLLTRFKNEWLAAGGTGSTLYPNLATYIKKKYDPNFYLTDAQITDLLTSYTSGCPLKRPIRIPGILTRCNDPKTPACLKCDQLYKVEQQFHTIYPQYPTSLPNYYDLLTGYINEVYQMNVAPSAVYAAIETCKNGGLYNDVCSNKCTTVKALLQRFYQLMPVSEYETKVVCGQLNCTDVLATFRQHITTWLNLNLGWNKTYTYYQQNYFSGCAATDYHEPNCYASKNAIAGQINPCSCSQGNIACCNDYPPFTLFRSLYPNPVDPRILAFFFELRNYSYCKPGNLPNISYTQPYATLVNYFNNLIPNVIPYCAEEGPKDFSKKINTSARKKSASFVSGCSFSGNVWHDINGMSDYYVNNSGGTAIPPAEAIPSGLYAYLFNPIWSNTTILGYTIYARTTVNSNGTYTMNVQYNEVPVVLITTAYYATGVDVSNIPASILPSGWVHTGEHFGSGAGSDGTNDGILESTDGDCPYTELNFGIKKNVVANPNCSSLWTFTFDSTRDVCTSIYDSTFAPGDFVLCSSPLTPVFQSDPDDCIKSTVSASLENADYAYKEYLKDFMRDYREAYFAKCMSITPSLVMEGKQQEYHYTLYYYDQAGNLVKTIPPKGVNYLTGTDLQEVGRLRDEDNGDCYENSTAPIFANTATHNVTVPFTTGTKFYPLQDAGPLTVESWVKFDNTNTKQVIINQFKDAGAPDPMNPNAPAGKAGYYAYIENGKLYFSMYGSSRETWEKKQIVWLYQNLLPNVRAHYYDHVTDITNRVKQFKAVCNTENLITANAGANNGFYHIVFQYSGDPNDKYPVKIFVNGVLQSLNWTASGNGASYAFTDGLANIPSTQVPAIDATIYLPKSVESGFTTAALNTDLVIGAISRTVDGQPMQGVAGRMKHLRIYNSAPEAADLRRNSYDGCFIPGTKEGLVLWLPLNKQVGGSTEDILSGGSVSITANWDNPALPKYPHHDLPTYYAYNSLNQVVHQETPDAGQSNFWYDRLGRLVVSQNAEQKTATNSIYNNRYSYTSYDQQGRILEVGEKINGNDITAVNTKDNTALATWLASGTDRQVTQTIYDQPDPNITADPQILSEQQHFYNSRKRVVTSVYRENKGQPGDYNYASHYIYDISGNVKRLYQENKKLPNGQTVYTTKTLDYDFDLISGKVNRVWYQKEKQDQYLYHYEYDADNKIVMAFSGRDELTLRRDAGYQYYKHGPLGRTELGHDANNSQVQGVDYAYTLQGWLKGINGLFLNEKNVSTGFDMGNDGVPADLHANIPADVYGYTLGYYSGDYDAINTRGGQHPVTAKTFVFNDPSDPANINATGNPLYNGNIAYTTYANRVLGTTLKPNSYSYQYDQLNRILKMRSHTPFALADAWSSTTVQTQNDYAEDVSYDANGNILTYSRNGTSKQQVSMDVLQYHYKDPQNNNKLDYVEDGVAATNYTDDIDNQAAGTYDYDKIGNLIKDHTNKPSEKINDIQWTVYGKIRSIAKDDGSLIEYGYDPTGNRISKTVTKGINKTTTYYFRDATGNVMAVYEQKETSQWTWKEQNLYGSSRIGIWNANITMDGTIPSPYDQTLIGSRHFELTNHLGNVLATISDRKLLTQPNNGCQPGTGLDILNIYSRGNESNYTARQEINFWPDFESKNPDNFTASINPNLPPCEPLPPAGSYYIADVITASDYYPFGMAMPGRKFSISEEYRYGFNGKENDKDISEGGQDYGMRIYDVRIGKFLSVDALTKQYPWYTPYQFAGNKPIIAVDLDGNEELIRINFYSEDGKNSSAVFIPLSTHETEKVFTDIWADINGITKYRNYQSGSQDRFTSTSSVMEKGEMEDYAEGNILKDGQDYKAPWTGQLTIDVNKSGSSYKYELSYKRQLTHDELYNDYKNSARVTNLYQVGYLSSEGMSKLGNFYTNTGTAASVTLGPEIGAPLILFGSGLNKASDGLDITLDYFRGDNSLANKKLFLFGISQGLDKGLGQAGKLAPSQQQKVDVMGATINNMSGSLKDQLKSDPSDNARPRKQEIIANSLNILRKI